MNKTVLKLTGLNPISRNLFALLLVIFSFLAFEATAHKGATGIVKERMDIMSDIGKVFAVIGDMIRGKTEFDAKVAEEAANSVKKHAIAVRSKFPDTEDSRNGKHSQTLENAWIDRPGFNYILSILEHESEKLGYAAASGNIATLKTQFLTTAKTCTSCHEKYRKPQ